MRRTTLFLLAVIFLAQVTGCSTNFKYKTIPELITPVKRQTSTLTVKPRTFENSIVAYTAVSYSDFYNLSFKGAKKIFFKKYAYIGKTVEQGELLAEADSYEVRQQITDMELELAKAKIDHQQLVDQNADPFIVEKSSLDISNTEVKLQALYRSIENTRIYAPVSGTVIFADETIKAGDEVPANKTIIKIVDRTKQTIELNLGDTAPLFKDGSFIGQSVKLYANGTEYDATCRQATSADKTLYPNTPNTRPLFVELTDPTVSLPVGTRVKIVLSISKQENVFVLPTYIIKKTGSTFSVRVYSGNKAVDRTVVPGETNGYETVIVSGLSENDKVLYK